MTDHLRPRTGDHLSKYTRSEVEPAPYGWTRPEVRNQASGPWVPAAAPAAVTWRTANPLARWLVMVGLVLLVSAVIVLLSMYAGSSAAESYGPLLPVATPSVTPFPGGWTP